MSGPNDDQVVVPNKKRVRRNALKPNSAESDSLREFSILHSLDSKMDLDGKGGVEEQKTEFGEELEGGAGDFVPEKRQKVPVSEIVEGNSTPKSPSTSEFPSCNDSEELRGGKQSVTTAHVEPSSGNSGNFNESGDLVTEGRA